MRSSVPEPYNDEMSVFEKGIAVLRVVYSNNSWKESKSKNVINGHNKHTYDAGA